MRVAICRSRRPRIEPVNFGIGVEHFDVKTRNRDAPLSCPYRQPVNPENSQHHEPLISLGDEVIELGRRFQPENTEPFFKLQGTA